MCCPSLDKSKRYRTSPVNLTAGFRTGCVSGVRIATEISPKEGAGPSNEVSA